MPALLARLRGAAAAMPRRSARPSPAWPRRRRGCHAGGGWSGSIFDLFIGVGRGELLPYASYYLTGFLHERPLAELRGDLAPPRHRARPGRAGAGGPHRLLCETYGRAAGRPLRAAARARAAETSSPATSGPGPRAASRDLEEAEAARFYRAVGALGRARLDIELAAAELPA